MSHFYPPLDIETIRHIPTVLKLYTQHPTYFLESPYPGEVERIFKTIKQPTVVVQTPEFQEAADDLDLEGANKWENLAKEARRIYKESKSIKYAGNGDNGLSPNERISHAKTMATLLEKLVSLEERALGLKKVHDFHRVVMEVMEEILTPTQRTNVMEKLQATIDSGAEE